MIITNIQNMKKMKKFKVKIQSRINKKILNLKMIEIQIINLLMMEKKQFIILMTILTQIRMF